MAPFGGCLRCTCCKCASPAGLRCENSAWALCVCAPACVVPMCIHSAEQGVLRRLPRHGHLPVVGLPLGPAHYLCRLDQTSGVFLAE
jgi:hypothetical protein